MKTRRRFTAEQKVQILREHLDNQVKISDLSEKYNINPGVIRSWKKELFEGALETFSGKHKQRKGKNSREAKLEAKISSMQEVITELTTENVHFKKKYYGEI
jgi:transposase-like protein